jgi:hypothetical protein
MIVMKLTVSEQLFARFCKEKSIRCCRITGKSRPDFEIFPKENRIVVEVAQFEPNPSDSAMMEEASSELASAGWPNTQKRIRWLIVNKYKQIKWHSGPTILAVADVGTGMGIDSGDIWTAMYGKDPKHGPACGPESNTSLSAIGHLSGSHLSIYHNKYSRHSVPFDWLECACQQFKPASILSNWEKILAGSSR